MDTRIWSPSSPWHVGQTTVLQDCYSRDTLHDSISIAGDEEEKVEKTLQLLSRADVPKPGRCTGGD